MTRNGGNGVWRLGLFWAGVWGHWPQRGVEGGGAPLRGLGRSPKEGASAAAGWADAPRAAGRADRRRGFVPGRERVFYWDSLKWGVVRGGMVMISPVLRWRTFLAPWVFGGAENGCFSVKFNQAFQGKYDSGQT